MRYRIPLLIQLYMLGMTIFITFSSPAFAETLNQKINNSFEKGELPGLHGVIVELKGNRLAEAYFEGEDESWGSPVGVVKHGPDTLHDLRSVTKSIVGLLYGIALDDHKVPGLDQPLYDQFPEYPDLIKQAGREKILVEHALSMQMGIYWNEDVPYSDPENSEIAMELAADRYRFALEQEIVSEPGELWTYSGGAVAILAKLIANGTNMPIDAYAEEKLFKPLGITHYEWSSGRDNVPSAASGLRLKLSDLIAIGNMVAQDGEYKNKRIVSSGWLKQMFTPRATLDEFTRYGLLWMLAGTPENIIAIGVGNGGQRLTIQPKHDLVVASFSGQYNDQTAWRTSLKLVTDFAVPEAKRVLGL